MASNIRSMTEGNPKKLIISFALPLMLGNIFQQLYTVVDTIVVGNFLSVVGLAAIGAGDWLNWGVLGSVQGFAQGFSIIMAQNFGAKKYDELKRNIADSICLTVIFSIFFTVAAQYFALPILHILKTPADIIDLTLAYLRVIFWGIPVTMFNNLLVSTLRALGDSKAPLKAMIYASFVNIGLDLFFIIVLHSGVAGAAIATVLAQVCSIIYCFNKLRKIEVVHIGDDDFTFDLYSLIKLINLGFPMAFQNAIIAVGGMIVQSVVNNYGVSFIGGFVATNKMYGILEIAAISFGYAMVTYAGQNLGAGKIDRIKKGTKDAILISIVTSMLIGLTMILFGKRLLTLFLSGEADQVALALNTGYTYLCIMSICLPVLYILHTVRSTIQGLGNTFLPMVSGFVEFIMRTVSVLYLPALLNEIGIFIAEPAAWFGADLILIPSYLYLIRKFTARNG